MLNCYGDWSAAEPALSAAAIVSELPAAAMLELPAAAMLELHAAAMLELPAVAMVSKLILGAQFSSTDFMLSQLGFAFTYYNLNCCK